MWQDLAQPLLALSAIIDSTYLKCMGSGNSSPDNLITIYQCLDYKSEMCLGPYGKLRVQ